MLEGGGNAVDAVVTAAFVLAVAFPTAGNLGGGGFAVVHFGGDDRALDFRETAPAAAGRDMYLTPGGAGADAGRAESGSRTGWRSSGTPASVAGLWALHAAKGSKPWKEVVAPAIAMARDGLVVDQAFSDEIRRPERSVSLAIRPRSRSFCQEAELAQGRHDLEEPGPRSRAGAGSRRSGPAGFYARDRRPRRLRRR